MRSTTNSKTSLRPVVLPGLLAVLLLAGCAPVHNTFVETGPFMTADLLTPSSKIVFAQYEPAALRTRDWATQHTTATPGVVIHGALYFEDPFEDKGVGYTEHGHYRHGWGDVIATPYGLARWTMNWLLWPVSLVVTPPWAVLESDGVISRQWLGYDHDATPVPDQPLGPLFVPEQPTFKYLRPPLPNWARGHRHEQPPVLQTAPPPVTTSDPDNDTTTDEPDAEATENDDQTPDPESD